jgi:hypothetical protein
MAGAADAGTVVISRSVMESRPQQWVLSTPESAVRSYLDWVSYAYRIGDSRVASATMSGDEGVHVDSYIQLNFQKSRLIDQTLLSVTFGEPTIEGTRATLASKEKWTYRYVSTKTAGEVLDGPYSASYDVSYALLKSDTGAWVVDSVDAKSLGEVK